MLTVLGVMIALAAMLVAVAAIWTYKNAMEMIAEKAKEAAEKVARGHCETVVPGIVDDVVRFNKEQGSTDPNQVAEAYAKEGQKA